LIRQSGKNTNPVMVSRGAVHQLTICKKYGNCSAMLIALPIAILYFLARKITVEYGLRSSGEARIAEGRAQRNAEHLTGYSPSSPLCVLCGYIPCLVTVCPCPR
jgi:hypothetical protein